MGQNPFLPVQFNSIQYVVDKRQALIFTIFAVTARELALFYIKFL